MYADTYIQTSFAVVEMAEIAALQRFACPVARAQQSVRNFSILPCLWDVKLSK